MHRALRTVLSNKILVAFFGVVLIGGALLGAYRVLQQKHITALTNSIVSIAVSDFFDDEHKSDHQRALIFKFKALLQQEVPLDELEQMIVDELDKKTGIWNTDQAVLNIGEALLTEEARKVHLLQKLGKNIMNEWWWMQIVRNHRSNIPTKATIGILIYLVLNTDQSNGYVYRDTLRDVCADRQVCLLYLPELLDGERRFLLTLLP